MQRFLYAVGRTLVGLALLSCAGTDKLVGTAPQESPIGVPVAGRMSTALPVAGPATGNGALAGEMSKTWPGGSAIPAATASVAATVTASASGRLLWQKPSTQQHSIWVFASSWSASYVVLPQVVPSGWMIVGTGDFDADGNTDIVWENLTTTLAQRSIWYMAGNEYKGRYAILPSAPAGWSISAVGDFNADTKPDLVWSHTSGQRSIWYMKGANGAVVSHYGILPTVPAAWKIVGAGDFNADNKTDLVWENLGEVSGKQHSIWIMNGGTYTGQYKLIASVPAGWSIAAVGDLTSDAKPDLVWQKTNGERSVWVMNGSVASSYVILPTVRDTQWDIAGVLAPVQTTGVIRVVTQTTGAQPDPTGYTIGVTAGRFAEVVDIGINGFRAFTRAPGSYTLTLGAIESNCTTTNNPRTVSVAAGATTEAIFSVSCPVAPTPTPPSNLSAVASATGVINLSWADNSSNESGFRIEQCVGVGCTSFVELGTVAANKTSEPITGVLAGTSYTYRIRAYNILGNSGYSNTATATGLARKIRVINNALATLFLKDVVRLKLAPNFNLFGDVDLLSDDRFTSCQSIEDISWISPGGGTSTFNQTLGQNYSVFIAMGTWEAGWPCTGTVFVWNRRTSFQTSPTGPLNYVYIGVNITGHSSGTVDFTVTGSYLIGTMRVQVSQGGNVWGTFPFTISSQ